MPGLLADAPHRVDGGGLGVERAQVSQWFTIYVFTASLQSYADPIIDLVDKHSVISKRFFRDVRCAPSFEGRARR